MEPTAEIRRLLDVRLLLGDDDTCQCRLAIVIDSSFRCPESGTDIYYFWICGVFDKPQRTRLAVA